MIGKILQKGRGEIYESLLAVSSKRTYDISATLKGEQVVGAPQAAANPYKKRPMKLKYDKSEYFSFRLPSEQHFLLSPFDSEDIFGKRKGIDHSPHIRAQLNLDSNLLFVYFVLTVLALACELKNHDEYIALRDNLVSHDMGKFSYDDFK